MCESSVSPEHTSILDDGLVNIPILNCENAKTVMEGLIKINIIAKKNGRIVNVNDKAGVNFYLINAGVTAAYPDRKMSVSDGYANVIVKLTMNEIYHLKKGEVNSITGKNVTEEQENEICYHERGHKELSGIIIPDDGLEFEEEFVPNITKDSQLKGWREKVKSDWDKKFGKIYDKARELYHGKYGEDGSPWTYGNNAHDSSWQDSILRTLKNEYSYELKDLSI